MSSRPSDPNKLAACRTDLGPLTRKLLEQQQEIERIRAERDEARRELCVAEAMLSPRDDKTPRMEAAERGWDCFKEGSDA